jgi:hypothetical protein
MVPKEDYLPPLPKTGKEIALCLNFWPIHDERACMILIGLESPQDVKVPLPADFVNGKPYIHQGKAFVEILHALGVGQGA